MGYNPVVFGRTRGNMATHLEKWKVMQCQTLIILVKVSSDSQPPRDTLSLHVCRFRGNELCRICGNCCCCAWSNSCSRARTHPWRKQMLHLTQRSFCAGSCNCPASWWTVSGAWFQRLFWMETGRFHDWWVDGRQVDGTVLGFSTYFL